MSGRQDGSDHDVLVIEDDEDAEPEFIASGIFAKPRRSKWAAFLEAEHSTACSVVIKQPTFARPIV